MRKFAVLAAVVLVTGCTFKFDAKIQSQKIPILNAGTKIPLAVGIYHSPEFKDYVHNELWMGEHYFVYQVGKESAGYFQRLFSDSFTHTEAVENRPPLTPREKPLSAVIETRIEKAQIDIPSPMSSGDTHKATLTYRFVLFAMDGKPATSWVVTGIGSSKENFGKAKYETSGEAVQLAMAEVGKHFRRSWAEESILSQWGNGRSFDGAGEMIDNSTPGLKKAVKVTAVPDLGRDRQKQVFGGILSDEGILPILVTVRNESKVPLQLRGWDSLMETQEGRNQIPLSPDVTSSRMELVSRTGGVAAALFGPLVGIAAASAEHDSLKVERVERTTAYRKIALWGTKVPPSGQIEGYLFFDLSNKTPGTIKHQLHLNLFNQKDGEVLPFLLPISATIPREDT